LPNLFELFKTDIPTSRDLSDKIGGCCTYEAPSFAEDTK
jgi:hypothetical protein